MPRKHEKKHFHLTVKVSCREAVLKGCFLHLPCYLGNSQSKDEQNVKILQLVLASQSSVDRITEVA